MLLVQIAISSQWTISSIIEDCCNIGFAYSSERTRHWLLGVAQEWFVRTRWFHGTIPIRAPVNAIHMLFLIASSQGKNSVLLVIVGWEVRRRRGNIGHLPALAVRQAFSIEEWSQWKFSRRRQTTHQLVSFQSPHVANNCHQFVWKRFASTVFEDNEETPKRMCSINSGTESYFNGRLVPQSTLTASNGNKKDQFPSFLTSMHPPKYRVRSQVLCIWDSEWTSTSSQCNFIDILSTPSIF